MKKFQFILLAGLITVGSAHANYPQSVQVCVNTTKNSAQTPFEVFFRSSDESASGHKTSWISSGDTCVQYTYSHGPKNLFVELLMDKHVHKLAVNPTSTCDGFVFDSAFPTYHNVFARTGKSNELWTFTVAQIDSKGRAYQLLCHHQGW